MNETPKNMAASVRARPLNIAREYFVPYH